MEFAHLWHCLPNWPLSCLWFHLSSFSSSSPSLVVSCCLLCVDNLIMMVGWLAALVGSFSTALPCLEGHWQSRESQSESDSESGESWSQSLPVGCLILIIEALQVAVVVGSGFKEAITRIYNMNELRQQFTFTFTFEIGFVSYSHCGYELQSFLLAKLVLVEYFYPFVVPACCQLSLRFVLFLFSPLFVVFAVAHTIYYNKFKCFALYSAYLWRLSMSFEMQMRRQMHMRELGRYNGERKSERKEILADCRINQKLTKSICLKPLAYILCF